MSAALPGLIIVDDLCSPQGQTSNPERSSDRDGLVWSVLGGRSWTKARFPLSRGGQAGFGEGEKNGKGTEKEVTVRTRECPEHAGASESVWTERRMRLRDQRK